MLTYINSGGPVMWLLIVLLVVIVVLAVRAVLGLREGAEAIAARTGSVHAILFWGVFAGVLGVYGQLAGIYRALIFIVNAPEISPPIIAEGIAVSFRTTLFGLLLMMSAGLVWFVLFNRCRALVRAGD